CCFNVCWFRYSDFAHGVGKKHCQSLDCNTGFTAYDCTNQTNAVVAYSLIDPAPCEDRSKGAEVERVVHGELVQQKKDRMLSVFRCQVVESVFSQYCGHASAAGVTRYLSFREPKAVEPAACRKAKETRTIKLDGRTFNVTLGGRTSESFFRHGGLDDGSHCAQGTLYTDDGKRIDKQATQSVMEIRVWEEMAKVNDLAGTITT
ncbi:MAG: hypothetical protein AN484_28065, partial [Aphanizomenon flos-aquae WA102]